MSVEPTCASVPKPGCQAVVALPSSVADAVFWRSPGIRPEEYASWSPVDAVGVRPTSRSISSSGTSADRLAAPAREKVRAVGRVNSRVIVDSGSLRGGIARCAGGSSPR